ncbi:energy transducer TonB family protein [Pseudobdellovibrio exovorus]|uniref:TonB protein n=1 Tax=Pseudobdellovibrio exovorus JSS TaxID=1184267 RepID=M4V8Y4_9BACT|nr:energy transducer TonB [Pseudobdellovibrio exovorus]AGH94910.1 tonB protein [Pseudobdellovibrio exovorus JSS]
MLFSFIFHFLLSTSALYFAEKLYQQNPTTELTQIEILDPASEPSLQDKLEQARQMVKQLDTTVKKINDPTLRARFESEKTQRVEKETKSNILGPTVNSVATPPPTPPQPEKVQKPAEDSDLPEFARPRVPSAPSQVSQPSAISSLLPSDIQNSNATNLNTDANIYYSFYSRVEDLFYVRWVERVRYYWDRLDPDFKRRNLSGKTWSTQIEVWLTSTGEYHSSYIRQSSGYKPFDDATVHAFQNAKFFPNPPRAKVEADGFVRLRYRFNVYVDAYRSN